LLDDEWFRLKWTEFAFLQSCANLGHQVFFIDAINKILPGNQQFKNVLFCGDFAVFSGCDFKQGINNFSVNLDQWGSDDSFDEFIEILMILGVG
jgi:hypothetical protein